MIKNLKLTSANKERFKTLNFCNNINVNLKVICANNQNQTYCSNCNYYIPTPFL